MPRYSLNSATKKSCRLALKPDHLNMRRWKKNQPGNNYSKSDNFSDPISHAALWPKHHTMKE